MDWVFHGLIIDDIVNVWHYKKWDQYCRCAYFVWFGWVKSLGQPIFSPINELKKNPLHVNLLTIFVVIMTRDLPTRRPKELEQRWLETNLLVVVPKAISQPNLASGSTQIWIYASLNEYLKCMELDCAKKHSVMVILSWSKLIYDGAETKQCWWVGKLVYNIYPVRSKWQAIFLAFLHNHW